ncbi:hypothetical protein [Paracoccus sp. J56]|uniref:hypothetical protein n=1 Tax=Paracoccus sp. J56 TaxID=935850 RepID=UPI000A09A044|nr:hypothetical protein [Paracoccus sp. J56]SMG39982.1 hypothetical protein SAMN02746000_02376 [Paracoccus sp. J56]
MVTPAEPTLADVLSDLDGLVARTEPAALRQLDKAALNRLHRDLRRMRDESEALRKALLLATSNASTEKRRRKAEQGDEAGQGTDKAERRLIKQAEKKTAKESDKAARKSAKSAASAADISAKEKAPAKAADKPKADKKVDG